ncbi:serine protease inhibitor 77Ba-like [Danaus plexippus]|uniref:serine protease inhibitor 77Ba-like n=1 Tax=Danaus plexippus TaxID=13037 RepID=UPI002AAF9EC9|nr:serine protease inhibitor 77Ba-like [Danaus plexippus]
MYTIFILFTLTATCFADFSDRARNFSIELLHYSQLEADGHVVISPFGIWSLMTGITLGATGESKSQIEKAFFLPKNEDTLVRGYKNLTKSVLEPQTYGVTLDIKNFVFLDKGFEINRNFQNTLSTDFGAMIQTLNFKDPNAAANVANRLIGKYGATVSNVLQSQDFLKSRMILTNVISFKGLWSSPFNQTETNLEPFYDENKKEIGKVNMMYQRYQFPFSNMKAMGAMVLELPYGVDQRYCMLVILPYPRNTVSSVYNTFERVTFKDIFAQLKSDEEEFGLVDIDVKLPRFKISTNVVLNKPLNSMGVYDIFEPGRASFDKVTTEEIYISAIVHKADIEVTEAGTVASAATSAYFADRIATPNFSANKPFLYFVMEKPTATVIFSGIYSKPSVF